MRILQIVTDTDRRGAQVFGAQLHEALRVHGHDVVTLALTPGRDPNGLRLDALGSQPLALRTFRALRAVMKTADVVVGHGSHALPACALAGVALPVPFVYRNIGDPLYWGNTARRRVRTRLLLRRTTAVAALWPGSAHALVTHFGVESRKVRVIPNAVSTDQWPLITPVERVRARSRLGLPAQRPVLLYVGALSREKNVAAAIQATVALDEHHLVVVGDGPLRPALEQLAATAAPERVTFTGPLAQPRMAFAAADVAVLPSLSEGIPAVLIEAGLCGIPAVATTVGGNAEVVRPRRTGTLVPPGDVDALTEGIREALDQAPRYGPAARAHCLARFDIAVVARAWNELLEEVAVGRRVSSGVGRPGCWALPSRERKR